MASLFKFFRLLSASFFGDQQQRYESKHQICVILAGRMGFRVYNKNLAWLHDDDYKKAWQAFSNEPDGKVHIHERKFNLFYLARTTYNIPGDIAECGVFHGGSSHLMLTATKGTAKHLYGFDSFEGLSDPKEIDLASEKRTFRWEKHDMTYEEDRARKNLSLHKDRFTLYKGWIPERFKEVDNIHFSLVHIDVDLYEPTLASIDFFYPRMSPGGIIVCDDYGFESCPGAKKAMDDYAASLGESVVHLTTGQGFLIKH